MLSWDEAEAIFDEALRDWDQLESLGGVCPFFAKPSLMRERLVSEFGYSIKKRFGDPKRVVEQIRSFMRNTFLQCAQMTAARMVLNGIRDNWRKDDCLVVWKPLRENLTTGKKRPVEKLSCYVEVYRPAEDYVLPMRRPAERTRLDCDSSMFEVMDYTLERYPNCMVVSQTQFGSSVIDPQSLREALERKGVFDVIFRTKGVVIDDEVDKMVRPYRQKWDSF